MLYPLLHWDTRFPAGYTGETVDLLMMDAAARTLRGASEVRRELGSTQFTQQSAILFLQIPSFSIRIVGTKSLRKN